VVAAVPVRRRGRQPGALPGQLWHRQLPGLRRGHPSSALL